MKRAVRTLIQLIASGMIIFGILEVGLELTRHLMQKADISLWHCLIGSLLIVVGTILLAASARLAERLTEDFEE